MIKIPNPKQTFTILALVAIGYILMAPPAFAIKLLGAEIPCDPALPPNAGGCGIRHFVQLIQVVIGFLQIIIIPIAVGFIVWGGFVIMTAGGSEEKVKQGKKIITAAVIGIVIALSAYLIITAFNFIISPEQFKFR